MGDNLIPMILFAFVGSFSPGPNNLMAMASGNAVGLWRTMPQIFGVMVGFAVMVVLFGLGLAQVLIAYPGLHGGFKVIGAIYLLYLAWRLARAGDPTAGGEAERQRALTFMEAALFQWLNPKAWTLAVGVVTAFTTSGDALIRELVIIIIVFAVMIIATLSVWALFGVAIRTFLSSDRQRRIVNYCMSGAVVFSVFMLFI